MRWRNQPFDACDLGSRTESPRMQLRRRSGIFIQRPAGGNVKDDSSGDAYYGAAGSFSILVTLTVRRGRMGLTFCLAVAGMHPPLPEQLASR